MNKNGSVEFNLKKTVDLERFVRTFNRCFPGGSIADVPVISAFEPDYRVLRVQVPPQSAEKLDLFLARYA